MPEARAVRRSRTAVLAAVALALALGSLLSALAVGSLPVAFSELVETLLAPSSGVVHDVVWQLRVPRALAAFACGGLLALAGALLQVLLRNALADPYVLGVSGGAALGALLALTLGLSVPALSVWSFVGASGAIAIVFALTYRAGDWNVYRVLLTGVVLSAGLSALISLMLVLAPEAQVKGMLFWLMGDLSQAESPMVSCFVLLGLMAFAVMAARDLDLLALGELKARSLGVAVSRLKLAVFAAAAAATVAAVVLGGTIGFVGLIIPHVVRLAGVANHRALIPISVLLGGSVLTIADTAARTAWAPQQLPVGIFTALIGVPAMLILLARQR